MGIYPLVNIQKLWKDPPFLVGKSTISMAIVNSYVSLPEDIWVISRLYLYYIILYCILYYIMLYYIMLCYIILY